MYAVHFRFMGLHYLWLHECYVAGMMNGKTDEDLNTIFDIQ